MADKYGTDYKAFEATADSTTTEKPLSSFAEKFENYLNKELIITPIRQDDTDGDKKITTNIKKIGDEIKKKRKIVNNEAEKKKREEAEKQRLEKERQKARLNQIKALFPRSPLLQKILEKTTEATDTLTIAEAKSYPNELLNNNRENLMKLLPNLKKLELDGIGKENILLSTHNSTASKLNKQIFTDFRTKLEELILSYNYVTNLSRLRKGSDGENITLKKIDLTGNRIKTLNYDDFRDLPDGAEIIIKDNPINRDAKTLQTFKDGLDTSLLAGKNLKFTFS